MLSIIIQWSSQLPWIAFICKMARSTLWSVFFFLFTFYYKIKKKHWGFVHEYNLFLPTYLPTCLPTYLPTYLPKQKFKLHIYDNTQVTLSCYLQICIKLSFTKIQRFLVISVNTSLETPVSPASSLGSPLASMDNTLDISMVSHSNYKTLSCFSNNTNCSFIP